MHLDWDYGNIDHIALHDVLPDEAEQVIDNDAMDVDVMLRDGETRMLNLGEADAGRVLLVVVTERTERYRVVTPRPANRNERAFYISFFYIGFKAPTNEKDPTDP